MVQKILAKDDESGASTVLIMGAYAVPYRELLKIIDGLWEHERQLKMDGRLRFAVLYNIQDFGGLVDARSAIRIGLHPEKLILLFLWRFCDNIAIDPRDEIY